MGEIVQLNFGASGNNIGNQYLGKLIQDDHPETSDISFFSVNQINNQPIFRGFFLDTDQNNINELLTSPLTRYLNPNSLLCSKKTSNGTYHNGQNIFINDLQTQFLDQIRRQAERNGKFSINYVHSIYDKSSGLSSAALKILNDEHPYLVHTTNSLFPIANLSNPIEIYNTVFSLHNLVEYSQGTIGYHYDALQKSVQKLSMSPTLENCHDIIAETILQNNCTQRLSGFPNCSIAKQLTNLVPFPRLHFFVCSFSPIKQSISEEVEKLQNLQNSFYTFDKDFNDTYMTQALILRSKDGHLLGKQRAKQIDWIDDGQLLVNCKVEHPLLGKTLMCIGNLRYFGHSFRIIAERYTASFRRKAFIHYYTTEGVDEMEFTEAESNCNDLISEYQDYGCSAYCEDE